MEKHFWCLNILTEQSFSFDCQSLIYCESKGNSGIVVCKMCGCNECNNAKLRSIRDNLMETIFDYTFRNLYWKSGKLLLALGIEKTNNYTKRKKSATKYRSMMTLTWQSNHNSMDNLTQPKKDGQTARQSIISYFLILNLHTHMHTYICAVIHIWTHLCTQRPTHIYAHRHRFKCAHMQTYVRLSSVWTKMQTVKHTQIHLCTSEQPPTVTHIYVFLYVCGNVCELSVHRIWYT